MSKETKTIRQTELIPAKPFDVYEAFMDEKKHTAFTGSKATSDPRVGGEFTAWDGYIFGKNLKLEKGKRIVQEWKTTEWPANYPISIVEFTFRETKNGTELTMVHQNVPAEQASSYRQGWIDFYWKPLKKYFKKKTH
jgi:activator of HSP90 ATPase